MGRIEYASFEAGVLHTSWGADNSGGTGFRALEPYKSVGSDCLAPAKSSDPGGMLAVDGPPAGKSAPGFQSFHGKHDRIRSVSIGAWRPKWHGLEDVASVGSSIGNYFFMVPHAHLSIFVSREQIAWGPFDTSKDKILLQSRLPFGLGLTIPVDIQIPEWTRFIYVATSYVMNFNAAVISNAFSSANHEDNDFYPLITSQVCLGIDKSE